jgi:hypothetical protein
MHAGNCIITIIEIERRVCKEIICDVSRDTWGIQSTLMIVITSTPSTPKYMKATSQRQYANFRKESARLLDCHSDEVHLGRSATLAILSRGDPFPLGNRF